MFEKKRAQISLFVIVGLVLLIVVVLMIFLARKADTTLGDDAAEKIAYELQAGALKDHVLSCINHVASDGLEKLGENGGLIYDFDGGKIPFKSLVMGENYLDYDFQGRKYFVAYGLRENHYCPKITYMIQEYPISNVPFSQFNSEYNREKECLLNHPSSDYDGFFGAVNLTKLCYSARSSGCEVFAKGNILGFTIQKQLEDYVSIHLPLCVNFSAFSGKMKAEIIQDAPPSAEVEIHDSETLFFVRYPIRIVFENQAPVSLIVDYQSRLDVRLGALYNFIYSSLSADSKNIKFNPATQYVTLPYWKQGLSMTRTKDACKDCTLPYSKDDILEFTDAKSLVNGHPLIFRTAVQDRRPALDLIPSQTVSWNIPNGLQISINAFDPDDSALTYHFMSEGLDGWYENSDSFQRIQQDLNDVPSILDLPIGPWDAGKHNVGILVIDDSGLFDYQPFTIEVTAQPAYRDDKCVSNCTSDNELPDYCESWCTISKNQCSARDAVCLGNWWNEFPSNPRLDCKECVKNVMDSYEREPHINCGTLSSYASCSQPQYESDCFWVNESVSASPLIFEERCVNDHEISLLKFPELQNYIIR